MYVTCHNHLYKNEIPCLPYKLTVPARDELDPAPDEVSHWKKLEKNPNLHETAV